MKPSGTAVACTRREAGDRQGRVCQVICACGQPLGLHPRTTRRTQTVLRAARRPLGDGGHRTVERARQPRPHDARQPRTTHPARTASGTGHPGTMRRSVGRRRMRHRRIGGRRQPGHDRGHSTRTPARGWHCITLNQGFINEALTTICHWQNRALGGFLRLPDGRCITICLGLAGHPAAVTSGTPCRRSRIVKCRQPWLVC